MATDYYSSTPHIVLTDEQVIAMRAAKGGVELRDAAGVRVGFANPANLPDDWTEEDIRLAKLARDSGGPRFTTEQVLSHLRSLERQ